MKKMDRHVKVLCPGCQKLKWDSKFKAHVKVKHPGLSDNLDLPALRAQARRRALHYSGEEDKKGDPIKPKGHQQADHICSEEGCTKRCKGCYCKKHNQASKERHKKYKDTHQVPAITSALPMTPQTAPNHPQPFRRRRALSPLAESVQVDPCLPCKTGKGVCKHDECTREGVNNYCHLHKPKNMENRKWEKRVYRKNIKRNLSAKTRATVLEDFVLQQPTPIPPNSIYLEDAQQHMFQRFRIFRAEEHPNLSYGNEDAKLEDPLCDNDCPTDGEQVKEAIRKSNKEIYESLRDYKKNKPIIENVAKYCLPTILQETEKSEAVKKGTKRKKLEAIQENS